MASKDKSAGEAACTLAICLLSMFVTTPLYLGLVGRILYLLNVGWVEWTMFAVYVPAVFCLIILGAIVKLAAAAG